MLGFRCCKEANGVDGGWADDTVPQVTDVQGSPATRLHDTRHTAATAMLTGSVHVRTVAGVADDR